MMAKNHQPAGNRVPFQQRYTHGLSKGRRAEAINMGLYP